MGITNAMTYSEKNIAPLVLGMSRHKNYQTSLAYQKPNENMYKIYNKAILGKHVPSPPKARRGKKVKYSGPSSIVDNAGNPDVNNHLDTLEDNNNDMDISYGGDVNATIGSVTVSECDEARPSVVLTTDNIQQNDVIVPRDGGRNATATYDRTVESGGLSLMSMLVSSTDSVNLSTGLPMVPIRPGVVNAVEDQLYCNYGGNPVYNTLHSNTVHRNYYVPPSSMRFCLESEFIHSHEEKRNWEHKVKELELQLLHQKEKYEDMKADLREVKQDGKKGDKQIMIGNCVIL
jgi:hypothetical protein